MTAIGRGATAVFFDVDFTLIYPGPTFQGEGYRRFCEARGVQVDASKFLDGVLAAAPILHDDRELAYNDEIFIRYTRRIIEVMGGQGEGVEAAAREIYAEWAACHHFLLYDDVEPALAELCRCRSQDRRCGEGIQNPLGDLGRGGGLAAAGGRQDG
jgi:hypothetical protein